MGQSSLYDDDILLWSEEQAALIRNLGRARPDLPNDLDVENVAEEIESVGRSELASVESFLRLLMVHLIKIASVPGSPAILHWREEALNFQIEALSRLSPSMLQRVDLDRAWRLACRQARSSLHVQDDPVIPLPSHSPWTVEELLSEEFDLNVSLAIIQIGGEASPGDPEVARKQTE